MDFARRIVIRVSRHPISDVVVVLPGILGSTLERNGVPIWSPSAGAVLRAIVTFGGNVKSLTLPSGIGDQHPSDGVRPMGLMPDLHLLPGIWTANIGYDRLLRWLTSHFTLQVPDPSQPERVPNLLPVAYDWRLSNRFNGRRLKGIVEPALERWRSLGGEKAEARLIFLCHSMGGLVARWYIEREGGDETTRKLVTIGTPHRGALTAAEQLVNGVEKGIGPLKVELTDFLRSLPSVYELLPQYACLQSGDGLATISESPLPLDGTLLGDAIAFHSELDATHPAQGSRYDLHPIVGTRQPTDTTAVLTGGKIKSSRKIGEMEEGGDGTVPRLSATPKALRPDSPTIRTVPDQHLGIHSNQAVLDELEGILTARPVIHRKSGGVEIGLDTESLLLAGTPLVVRVKVGNEEPVGLMAELLDEGGRIRQRKKLRLQGDGQGCRFDPPSAGAWCVRVVGIGAVASRVEPVQRTTLIWPEDLPS